MKSKKAQTARKASTKTAPKGKSKFSRLRGTLIRWSLLLVLLGVLALFSLFGAVYIGLFGKLPNREALLDLRNANASELYGVDGTLLGLYFIENRSSIDFQDIPEVVIEALVATEDNRFFEHEGIDLYSIPRVVVRTIILGDRSGGGGSTISQQLVKNLFGRSDHGALSMPVNKLKENVTALTLEDLYTKEEIITLYLNTVSFGENVFGIKAASQRYYSKLPKDLTPTEAATLIGILKANTTYNPRLHPEAALKRRNTVLGLMVKEGFIEPEELNALIAMPLGLRYRKMDGSEAPAGYFRAFAEKEIKQALETASARDGVTYDLYRDGLVVKTTVNGRLQQYAEEAVRNHMRKVQASFDAHWKGKEPWGTDAEFLWKAAAQSERYKRMRSKGASDPEIKKAFTTATTLLRFTYDGYVKAEMTPLDSVAYHQMILQASFLALDPRSGAVLAYVGGIHHSQFPYDHVRSGRQVGSTFKPFVYATAIDQGMSPCDYIENERIIFANYNDWSPENSNGEYGGYYSLRGGLAHSVNTVAAQLIAETGPEAVVDLARRAGIRAPMEAVPAISLGTANISLLEMVTAYAVFANGGQRITPHFLSTISTSDGKVIYTSRPEKPVQAIESATALTTLHMLQAVIDSGTARNLRGAYGVKAPLAGKTGTTQNNADGWFIATTPGIVCGAWVGGASPVVRFRSTSLGQGAVTAMPIVATFLRKAETDGKTASLVGRSFPEIPAGIRLDALCPMYMEHRSERLFDSMFGGKDREEKQELRKQIREERRKEREDSKEENVGWMKRLVKKLKKEE